jgi:hypothetical protein
MTRKSRPPALGISKRHLRSPWVDDEVMEQQFAFLERAVHLEQQNIDVLRTVLDTWAHPRGPTRRAGSVESGHEGTQAPGGCQSGTATARGGQKSSGPRGRDPRSANEIKAVATQLSLVPPPRADDAHRAGWIYFRHGLRDRSVGRNQCRYWG